jgi:predicted CXXCH cytochrome family protein
MSPRLVLGALAAALVFAACGNDGAPQSTGGPPPIDQVYGQCAFCHDSVAMPMYATGGHGGFTVNCETCHSQDLTPGRVGPNHRNVPVCADCHTKQMTHMDPAAGTPQQCLVCHTPHGSPNLFLVNTELTVPDGNVVPIDFTNLLGKADGSFASASDPGTGLCEVCHATTTFYNSEGTGAAHFTNNCVVCHKHDAAFAPPP